MFSHVLRTKLFESAVFISGWVATPNRLPTSGLRYKQATNTNTEHLNRGQLALSVMRKAVCGGTQHIVFYII